MADRPSLTVAFAGGGSGGHLSPALAIAERLLEERADSRTVFICSQRPIDAHMLSQAGVTFCPVAARPPALRPDRAFAFARGWPISVSDCASILKRERVDRVVAMGGFVAAPAVAAARRLDIPVLLLNLDAPPGRANRWIARRATTTITAPPLPDFPGFARRAVGMPLRRCALAPARADQCRAALDLDEDLPVLLITGASQGATSLNQLMMALLLHHADAFAGWQVLHLCGTAADDSALRQSYKKAEVPAQVLSFLNEIGLAWGAADLALSRAGANSVAEIRANAIPALFLPYPFHRDQHQRHNAAPLESAGGAVIETDLVHADKNRTAAGAVLIELLRDETRRAAMRDALQSLETPDAALAVARELLA